MKRLRKTTLLALMLAGGFGAFAQTNNIPRATDFSAFSRFVTDRNIFDPNRQPHYTSSRTRPKTTLRTHSPSAPAFTLVGTMSYEKGLFAFFSGNDADLKKVLPATGKIAGYTVVEIAPGRVTLTTTNTIEKLELKVGDVVRQENGKWQLSGTTETPAGESASATGTTNAPGSENPAATASPALEQNDVLKRLMEKRAKETP